MPIAYIIQTTFDNEKEAKQIARSLVKQKIGNCVQLIGPITSIYEWNNDIEESQEWLCQIKTSQKNKENVMNEIKRQHPYDLPEIIAIPIESADEDYLSWLNN